MEEDNNGQEDNNGRFTLPCADDLARLIIPSAVTGPPIVDKIDYCSSAKVGIDKVKVILKEYNIDGTTISSHKSITQIRKDPNVAISIKDKLSGHTSVNYSPGRNCPIYCKRCFNLDVFNPDKLNLRVVAVIKFGDADVVEEEGDGDTEVEGGDQKAPIKCATVQLVAFDISDITIDGEDYPVSKNPRLKNLAKPGSFWLPLHDYRCIMFRRLNSLQRVKVDCGSCVVFSGDTPHCGETHVPALYSSYTWHPYLHIYIMSKHHEVNLGKFDVDVDGIMLFQPEHIV